MSEESISRPGVSFKRALSWSYVLTGSRVFIALVVSLVLAYVLGPEAFGLVAMAMAFIALVELLVKQGLASAIIQRPGLTSLHLDAAFWMTVIAAAVLTPGVLLASGWWAEVNGTPELRLVLIVLSLLIPLKGLAVVQEATILRELDFRSLAIRTSTSTILGGILGIAAALLGAGVWALVIQQLVTAAGELVLIWTLSSWRPRWRFDRRHAVELFGFSGKTTVASIAVYLTRQADALLVGLFFGPVVVGLYRMATRLINIALEVATGALHSTFLPELSRHEHDPDAFVGRTLELLRLSGLLAIPLLGGLAATSSPLLALLGDDWRPAVSAIQIMCVLAVLQSFSVFTGPILQAAGRPGAFAWLTSASALVSVATFVGLGLLITSPSTQGQVNAIAVGRTLMQGGVILVIVVPTLYAVIGIRPLALGRALAPPILATSVGFVVSFGLGLPLLDWARGPFIDLLWSGFAYVLVTGGMLLMIEPRSRDAIRWVRVRMKSRTSEIGA